MIPIYKPYLNSQTLQYAHEAIDSGWISSQGQYIEMAKEKLQELLGVKYVLPVFNGTVACHLVAKALNKKVSKEKHKILCPDNVYVAAWNAFLFDKDAFQLITVKTNLDTWNIDLLDLDKKIKLYPEASVLIVHNLGNIINVPELKKIYPNTLFIEDACEALLGRYNNVYAGTESLISAFSFFANKTLTAGESGCVLTNDEDLYSYLKCIQSQGQSDKRFVHKELGYNYRITNIQSALLIGQIEIADQIMQMKNDIFARYRKALKNREDVLIQWEASGTINANWMFGIRIKKQQSYETAEAFFKNKGIEIRPMFYPIAAHTHLANNENVIIDDCTVAEQLNKECIILPSFPELTNEEQGYILDRLDEYVKTIDK